MSARAWFAGHLERGGHGPATRAISQLWSSLSRARVSRPLTIPETSTGTPARLIGVGGATLGGSCKTPVAIALARALAAQGARVALVGHAYRARPGRARWVGPLDDPREVGDDALYAARELSTSGALVAIAPSRQAAVDFATARADCLIVDGLLQASPHRLARSILLLDGKNPWGGGACPPAGDLRAPRDALLAAADIVLRVGDNPIDHEHEHEIASRLVACRYADGRALALSELKHLDFGLILAIARPSRVAETLARHGLVARADLRFGDHDTPSQGDLRRLVEKTPRVDLWLTTAKCATKLPASVAGAPILVLEHQVDLPTGLVDWALSDSSLPLFPGARPVVDCAPCETPAGK